MAKVLDAIDDDLRGWIERQPLFFNATAPLATNGHINLSPRGLDTFRVLGPRQAAYLDLTGSGNETAAHLQENGRITIMFCAFEGDPLILRLYGRGEVVLPEHPDWPNLLARFPRLPGIRQIVRIDIDRLQSSCGYSVPLMGLVGPRERLNQWAEKKGAEGLVSYRKEKNRRSIDGLSAPFSGAAIPWKNDNDKT